MKSVICRLRTLALSVLALGGAAQATTLVAADVPALSRRSDAVMHATVKKVSSRWTGDHMRIVTDVELEVTESIKGATGKTLHIVQPGGVVGDIGQRVDGLAAFEPGEEVVVFLEKRGGGTFLVAGMAQGKYRVERSSDGKAAYAVPESLAETRVIDPVTRQALTSTSRSSLKLEDLKAQVRAAAAAGKSDAPPPSSPTKKATP